MGFTHLLADRCAAAATATDYAEIGLYADDPDLLKGQAGSPYAIKDYFDVCPDYADDPAGRLEEFDALIKRCAHASTASDHRLRGESCRALLPLAWSAPISTSERTTTGAASSIRETTSSIFRRFPRRRSALEIADVCQRAGDQPDVFVLALDCGELRPQYN